VTDPSLCKRLNRARSARTGCATELRSGGRGHLSVLGRPRAVRRRKSAASATDYQRDPQLAAIGVGVGKALVVPTTIGSAGRVPRFTIASSPKRTIIRMPRRLDPDGCVAAPATRPADAHDLPLLSHRSAIASMPADFRSSRDAAKAGAAFRTTGDGYRAAQRVTGRHRRHDAAAVAAGGPGRRRG